MTKISEAEFARICDGIGADADAIYRHNPIGTPEETLLWMLLGVLINYLSLDEIETPCFSGSPTADTYRDAISFVLKHRKTDAFDEREYLKRLAKTDY